MLFRSQLAYFTICWRFWRGTLGQRITHLEVVSVTGGKAISLMDAIVRWAVLQGPFAAVTIAPQGVRLFLLLAAISWTIFLFYSTKNNAETRGLHDRVAGSRVSLEL